MKTNDKIYVAGHRGMVGLAIVRQLEQEGYRNLLLKSSSELDLKNQQQVEQFFRHERPDYVFLAAAKVGGIHANNIYRAEFIYNNLMIQSNIIHQSYLAGVKKLMFLGSSCIYPKLAQQPITEEYLLTGELESSNEPYAIAKIAGIKMCDSYRSQYGCNFISVMPTNLYGPNDNYDLVSSHVLPALIRKFHEAKKNQLDEVVIWGTGKPRREFLHANDLADACFFLMKNYDEPGLVNIGVGTDISIAELGQIVKEVVDFRGQVVFNPVMPDGTPRKLLDVSKLHSLGWKHRISLVEGIHMTYSDFINNHYQSKELLVA